MSGFHLYDITNSIDHELPEGKTIVGRSTECDIRLLSSNVSRKHGMFEVADNQLTFSDLGSSNGSFVNGQQANAPVPLRHGDKLAIGEFEFSVSCDTAGTADAAAPEEATQLSAAGGAAREEDIPAMWSESAGLEQASGTQFFANADLTDAASDYRAGRIEVPPLGDTPRLVGLSGSIRGKLFTLDGGGESRTWKIGRDSASVDLVIPEESVSSQHAQLVNDGARWKIVNWMSTNGTFVNGQKGLSTYLKSGDVIRMGSAELAFELPAGSGGRDQSQKKEKANADGQGFFSRLFARLFGRKG